MRINNKKFSSVPKSKNQVMSNDNKHTKKRKESVNGPISNNINTNNKMSKKPVDNRKKVLVLVQTEYCLSNYFSRS